jgi:hypothetical protein
MAGKRSLLRRNSFSVAQAAVDGASAPRADSELHSLELELSCARALLDALETVLDREHPERAPRDVIIQVAEQLARTAIALKQWAVNGVGNSQSERRRD